MKVEQARARLQAAMGKRAHLIDQIKQEKAALLQSQQNNGACAVAQHILQESARLTQEQLEYRISTIATMAMEAVFNDPYEISLQFDISRGKTGAFLAFKKDEELVDPLMGCGGGAVDVASFGLQVSLWALQIPRSRNVLILDEPLKWLKGGGLPENGARMVKQISQKLGIQIIMVSHSEELIDSADKVFRVTKKNGISTVGEVLCKSKLN